jgi:hypothetical protein
LLFGSEDNGALHSVSIRAIWAKIR